MRMKALAIVTVATLVGLIGGAQISLTAQRGQKPPAGPAAAGRDLKTVLYDWANHMGMLRELDEHDAIATIEIFGTGTLNLGGQPCKLTNYRTSINYQTPGTRVRYTCTGPDGQTHTGGHVLSGQLAWDEVGPIGAGIVPGQGTAVPNPGALHERLIELWSGPQGALKAATAGGQNTKVGVEGGKTVVTFPIPGVAGAIAKATLNPNNPSMTAISGYAERVETRLGNVVWEFTYSNYADQNREDEKLDAFFPGHIVEKRGTVTVLDLTVTQTNLGNYYVVIPVPANVKNAAPARP